MWMLDKGARAQHAHRAAAPLETSRGGQAGSTLGMKTEQKYSELIVFVFYIMNRFLI
jgi:hypothetical protein